MKNPASIGYLQEKISSEYIDKEFIDQLPIRQTRIRKVAEALLKKDITNRDK